MLNAKIKNIIFDLGNTLVFFDFAYFYEGVSRLEKNLKPEALRKFISEKKLGDKLCMGKILPKQAFRIIKKKFDMKIGYNDFIYLYADIFWENSPMKNFLEKIIKDRKYKIVLLSNTDIIHYKFINKNFPYINLIKNKVLSFKVGMMKPAKNETLVIDDMRENIAAAASLGIRTLHYTTHKQFVRKFSALNKK
jgi:FMN phosphatase YigB (HAD superfamily)